MGIEPTLLAWEAKVLPLNYTRVEQAAIIRGYPLPGKKNTPHKAGCFRRPRG